MSDEELDALIDKAVNLDSKTANNENTGGISTFALPRNLTNELEAIYNAGVNIKRQIQDLYSLMPTTNGDLKDQISEVSNFVMRQDRWIVLRIDALASVVSEYKTRIDTNYSRATDIHNYAITNRSRISSLDNQLQPLKSTVTAINDYAVTNRARISSLDVQLQALKEYALSNRGRITTLDSRLTTNEDYAVTNRARISNLDGQLQDEKAYSQTNRGRITTLDGRLTANEAYSESNRGRISTLDARTSVVESTSAEARARSLVNEADISALALAVAKPDLSLFSNLFGVNTIALAQSSSDGVYTRLQKFLTNELRGQLIEIRSVLGTTNAKLDLINSTLMEEIKGQLVMVRNNITVLNANMLLNTAAVNSSSNKNAENLTLINTTLKGLKNYDDVSLKKTITDSIKTVTDAIKGVKDYTTLLTTLNATNLLNTVAVNNFSDVVKSNFVTLFVGIEGIQKDIKASKYDDSSFKSTITKLFSDNFNAVPSGYESSAVSGDGLFTRLVKGQFTRLMNNNFLNLEVFNKALTDNLRSEFALLNDWFALVVEWLDMIYTKPTAVFEGAAFDYNRLQEMLDGISFGNVVNEAGTNLWDVLQELISALGGVVESVLNIVPDLIEQLIALIIPENPNFFSDDINALIDSFDSKFEWTGTLTNTFTSVFSQPKSIKSLTVTVAGKSYKVVPDFVDLGLIKTILTGYFCFLTVLTTYRRIVGSGDIVQ